MAENAIERDNVLTRFMRQVADVNAAAGFSAGRSSEGPAGADPPTRVRSNAMASSLKPLTAEERAELDRKAKELGIMPKDELDELAEPEDNEEMLMVPVPSVGLPVPGSVRAVAPSQILKDARGGVGAIPVRRPQLPDFRNVEVFDLTTDTIRVDGMTFPIPPEDVLAMKSYAVQIVLDHVVAQLAKALIEFGVPGTAATEAAERLRESINDRKEAMPEVREGTTPNGVSPESDQVEKLGLSDVCSIGVEGLSAVGEGTSEATPE